MGFIGAAAIIMTAPCAWAGTQENTDDLKNEVKKLNSEIDKLNKRLDSAEMHTATDKLALGVELRSRADSIHYQDILTAPSSMMSAFFAPPPSGFNGATMSQIQQGMGGMAAAGMIPAPEKNDADNDVMYTTRFRLNMSSKISDKLSFSGRMAAYKAWGDSTGVKFNQGTLGDVTLDGNTSSLPHGDTIHLERAYFNYKTDMGQIPLNFSLGRRPSTEGPPQEYEMNSLEGGSPLATIINWQFDGASLNFGLEDLTGISGAAFKVCYGVGFEGDWGNSASMSGDNSGVDDVNMGGFIATFFDDGRTSAVLNYAHAWDVTDGFTGLTVMPFTVSSMDTNGDGVKEMVFEPNSGAFISRIEPTANIGDWDGASFLVRSNLEELIANIDVFAAVSWSHTNPSGLSANPYYALFGQGLLNSNGETESRDGYSIYTGAVFPVALTGGKFGLEYNWGSEYWLNFTGAEDSLIGSKLAARGSVYEAYFHQPVVGDKFFVTIGGRYYDYEYTGSGSPLGEPVKISEATSMDTIMPVIDTAWNGYVSATLRF